MKTKDFFKGEINKISKHLYSRSHLGNIYNCDAIDFLENMQSEVADIVFLDPPFNLGKKYGSSNKKEDKKNEAKYSKFLMETVEHSIRILKPGGALFFYHIPQRAITVANYLGQQLTFRHWIAISMKNGYVQGKRLYPAHYSLLFYSKGESNYFLRPKIPPAECRHCGKYIKDYGGYTKYIEKGINLSDVWDDLSPVRHSKYKNRSANELPIELLRRVVAISGDEGFLLVDPFVGSGTSLEAACEFNLRFLCCDREEEFCEISKERVARYKKSQK